MKTQLFDLTAKRFANKKNRMSHDNRFSKTNYLKTNLLKQIKKYFIHHIMIECKITLI